MKTQANQNAPTNRRGRSPFRHSGFATPPVRSIVVGPAVGELGRHRPVTASEIDNAVLAMSEAGWRKVAMIILKAAERLGPALPEGDPGYQMIAQRVEGLVIAGRLVSQGDISRWRHSEVSLP